MVDFDGDFCDEHAEAYDRFDKYRIRHDIHWLIKNETRRGIHQGEGNFKTERVGSE